MFQISSFGSSKKYAQALPNDAQDAKQHALSDADLGIKVTLRSTLFVLGQFSKAWR
jgi:hypothetical protein